MIVGQVYVQYCLMWSSQAPWSNDLGCGVECVRAVLPTVCFMPCMPCTVSRCVPADNWLTLYIDTDICRQCQNLSITKPWMYLRHIIEILLIRSKRISFDLAFKRTDTVCWANSVASLTSCVKLSVYNVISSDLLLKHKKIHCIKHTRCCSSIRNKNKN